MKPSDYGAVFIVQMSMLHQWLKGNITPNAKCMGCGRPCGSKKRLQDFRCLWCNITVRLVSCLSACLCQYILARIFVRLLANHVTIMEFWKLKRRLVKMIKYECGHQTTVRWKVEGRGGGGGEGREVGEGGYQIHVSQSAPIPPLSASSGIVWLFHLCSFTIQKTSWDWFILVFYSAGVHSMQISPFPGSCFLQKCAACQVFIWWQCPLCVTSHGNQGRQSVWLLCGEYPHAAFRDVFYLDVKAANFLRQYSGAQVPRTDFQWFNCQFSISNFSRSLTRNITSDSIENLVFHNLLRWKMIILPIPTTSLIHFFLGRMGECTFWTWEWRV